MIDPNNSSENNQLQIVSYRSKPRSLRHLSRTDHSPSPRFRAKTWLRLSSSSESSIGGIGKGRTTQMATDAVFHFEGCDTHQSGQRLLGSSDPRLKRHVASCETAGGGIDPLPAGKDEKLPGEFEGGALIGRAAPVPYLACRSTEQSKQTGQQTSRSQQTSNEANGWRDLPAPPFELLPNGRKRLCGAWTLHGRGSAHGSPGRPRKGAIARTNRYVRLRCKCWGCSLCGPRKAARYRQQILRAVGRWKLTRFLTLTLDVRKLASESDAATFLTHLEIHRSLGTACHCGTCAKLQALSITYINECWSKLRTYLRREFGIAPTYIAVREFQKSTGMAHMHIVVDCYIDQAWVKESWQSVGGGQHVHIQRIDVHRAAAYLSKYLAKDMLLNAPPGMRRVTTSRSITLFCKTKSDYSWQIVRTTIDRLYLLLDESAVDVVRNEGKLASFAVRE